VRLRDLQAAASVAVVLMGSMAQPGFAQVQKVDTGRSGQSVAAGQQELPTAPTPKQTEPLFMLDTPVDYSQPRHQTLRHPFDAYKGMDYPLPKLSNSPRLRDLLQDGKLYLSLSDAVTLAHGLPYNRRRCSSRPIHLSAPPSRTAWARISSSPPAKAKAALAGEPFWKG